MVKWECEKLSGIRRDPDQIPGLIKFVSLVVVNQLSIASFLWGPGYLVSTGKTTLSTVTSGEAVLVSLSGIEAVVVPRIL